MKRVINIFLILLVFTALLYFFQEKVIFFPYKMPEGYPLPNVPGISFERVSFPSGDGVKIDAMVVSRVASGTPDLSYPSRVILFSHGNAGNLLHRIEKMVTLVQRFPIQFFIYDYRGFGASEGSPTVDGARLDGEAALKFLTETRKIPIEKIVLYGESLGTGVSCTILQNVGKKCAGLVFECGFRSLASRAGARFPIIGPLVLKSSLPSDEIIKKYQGPLLVIHSKGDQVIPFEDGKFIFDSCPSTKKEMLAMTDVGHNDKICDRPDYLSAWEKFFQSLP